MTTAAGAIPAAGLRGLVARGAAQAGGTRVAVLALAALGLFFLQLLGAPLGGATATLGASAAILVFGLPHGAFDLALIRRARSDGVRRLAPLTGLYLGYAGGAWLLWRTAPELALVVFLGVAVIHFAEEWEDAGAALLAGALALSLLAAPALLHHGELRRIFVGLTGRPASAGVAEGLLLLAPMAVCGALVAVVALAQAGRRDLAVAAAISLAAMIALPPAVGFAVFFCLSHSPLHFATAAAALGRRRLAQWAPVVAPVTLLALALAAALYLAAPAGAASSRLLSATFMALWVLTVPHMLVPPSLLAIERLCGARASRAAA